MRKRTFLCLVIREDWIGVVGPRGKNITRLSSRPKTLAIGVPVLYQAQFSEKTGACRKKRCAEYYTALYRLPDSGAVSPENSYGLAELTVRPPLIPGAVDGQRGAGMLDIDEEHLAIGREGRAGEFGIVHAVVPEAVDLACGRYAD